MSTNVFPPFKFLSELLEYNTAPNREQKGVEIQKRETKLFLARHRDDYYPNDFNGAIVSAWLSLYGVPALLWNLEIAFNDLLNDGLLEARAAAAEIGEENLPDNGGIFRERWPGATLSRSDVLAEYQPSDAEAAQLAKLADDPSLNDSQRKARLRKLALLAGKQRRSLSTLNRDPDIVI